MKRALGWLAMLGGIGLLCLAVADLVLWVDSVAGWLRVVVEGAAAGALLAPGALLSQGHALNGMPWAPASAITALTSALVLGWVAGMAASQRLGWPAWAVHIGAGVALVGLVAGAVVYALRTDAARR